MTGFNAVDATYRTDLRELNELNLQRFDAGDEQRFAEADAKLERGLAELRGEMATLRTDVLKWMFGFWIATLVPLAGQMVGLFMLQG